MDSREIAQSQKLISRRESVQSKKVYNEWNKSCWHTGCPLKPTMKTDSGQECMYHFQSAFPSAITSAIRSNMKYLDMYAKMVRWTEEDWRHQEVYLQTKAPFKMEAPSTPVKPNQFRSIYLNSFFKWIEKKIKDDASRIIGQ